MGLNYSGLNLFQVCPQKYKEVYINLQTPPPTKSGDMLFGTAIHLGCEEYLNGENGSKTFELFWDLQQKENLTYTRFKWDALKEMGLTLLDRFERLHLKHLTPLCLEQRLYADIKGIEFEGTPDFIGSYKGNNCLLDFKTSSYAYNKLAAAVSEQLHLYAKLAELTLSINIDRLVYFVFIKAPKPSISVVEYEINPELHKDVISQLAKKASLIVNSIKEDSYAKNYSSCVSRYGECEFFSKCHKSRCN